MVEIRIDSRVTCTLYCDDPITSKLGDDFFQHLLRRWYQYQEQWCVNCYFDAFISRYFSMKVVYSVGVIVKKSEIKMKKSQI